MTFLSSLKYFVLIIIVSLVFASCESLRRSVDSDSHPDSSLTEKTKIPVFEKTATMQLIDSLNLVRQAPNDIYYHFKGTYSSGGNNMPMNGVCGIKKDSLIWISIRPGLGIEIGRLYFNADSIVIIDRINSEYYKHSYKEISKQLGHNVGYKHFEALFSASILTINEAGEPHGFHYSHRSETDRIMLMRVLDKGNRHAQELYHNGLPRTNAISDKHDKSIFSAEYVYANPKEFQFPQLVNAEITANAKMELSFTIHRYSDLPRNIPEMKIPAYYTQKALKF